ncbi:apolipoprotein D-like [Lingula anatina]|uniref:Apolipoprotein D n=1 Tax=Lingula anatina TaxID=7574 RepID=A0A2R2MJN5_LINAN|nr:apolipoprotein D-like [Lingula anatina]|eukprot:XP_023930419.1 apolipoprotein D-like [Lingula anatina]
MIRIWYLNPRSSVNLSQHQDTCTMLRAVLSLVFVSLVAAQVPGIGKCPPAKPMTSFDLEKYLGKWYEIQRFFAAFQAGMDCVSANYSSKPDGHIKVYNVGYKSGKENALEGDGYAPDAGSPAKLAVRFAAGTPYAPYWVLATDYNTYSLVFSCEEVLGIGHIEFSWILARKRSLDPATLDKLRGILKDNGANPANYKDTNQRNCPAY